jgi:hypothetical protein
MIQWILSLLANPVLDKLAGGWRDYLAAKNTQDAQATELAVAELKAEIEARKIASAQIIAEQGRWWTALPRPLFAAPFIIFAWKVVVWDKVLGWGTTDALTGAVADWAGYVLVAYFGGRSLEKVARVFKGRG